MEGAIKFWWAILLGFALISQTILSFVGGQVQDLPPPHHRPLLTEEQKACVEQLLGNPEAGAMPSREQRNRAFGRCGIGRAPASASAEKPGEDEEI